MCAGLAGSFGFSPPQPVFVDVSVFYIIRPLMPLTCKSFGSWSISGTDWFDFTVNGRKVERVVDLKRWYKEVRELTNCRRKGRADGRTDKVICKDRFAPKNCLYSCALSFPLLKMLPVRLSWPAWPPCWPPAPGTRSCCSRQTRCSCRHPVLGYLCNVSS